MQLRRLHRLFGLLIGVPSLLWGLSGMLLAWKNWARDAQPAPASTPPAAAGPPRPFAIDVSRALASSHHPAGEPLAVDWRRLAGHPYYVLHYPSPPRTVLIDGESGQPQPGIDAALARQIAAAAAPAGSQVESCQLQQQPSLIYLSGGEFPVFRIGLSDGSDVYIAPSSGELLFRATRMQWAIRFAFYGLHVWKWSSAPGPHYSYWVLLFMGLGLCISGASGIWLNLRLLLPSRRKASPPSGPQPGPPPST